MCGTKRGDGGLKKPLLVVPEKAMAYYILVNGCAGDKLEKEVIGDIGYWESEGTRSERYLLPKKRKIKWKLQWEKA